MKTNSRFWLLLLLAVLGTLFLRLDDDSIETLSVSVETPAAVVSSEQWFPVAVGNRIDPLEASEVPISPVSADSVLVEESLGSEAFEALSGVLPDWMLEVPEDGGFQDSREIFGHTVNRIRRRDTWENGSFIEVEITDAGEGVTEVLVKNLGFDLMHANSDSDYELTRVYDEGDVMVNQEYNYNDYSGSLQLFVDGRYLVEIQLQMLPLESFMEVLDEQLSYDELCRTLGRWIPLL